MFRTKAINEITNAHLADGSSSSYFGIVRLSFSVFALRDRRKKLALCTRFFSHTHTIDSGPTLNQSVTFSDHRTYLRHRDSIASWWNFQRKLFARDWTIVGAGLRLTPFFPWYAYLSILREVLACAQWSIELLYGVKVAGRSSIERSTRRMSSLKTVFHVAGKRTFVVESVFHTAWEKRYPIIVVKVCRYHVRHVTRKSSRPCPPIRKKAAQALSAGQSRDLIGTLLIFLSIIPNINPRFTARSLIFAA